MVDIAAQSRVRARTPPMPGPLIPDDHILRSRREGDNLQKKHHLLNFSYICNVCPEPVLANFRVLVSTNYPHTKWVISHAPVAESFHHSGLGSDRGGLLARAASARSPLSSCKNHVSFDEFSLCLSQACLGKMIGFCRSRRKTLILLAR